MSQTHQFPLEQSSPGAEQAALFLRVQSVNVYVRDLEKSLRFYMDQLGFEVAFDVILQSGQRWVGVAPPDGTAVLTLITPAEDSEEYKLIGRPTQVVFVTENVTAQLWRVEKARGPLRPQSAAAQDQVPAGPAARSNPGHWRSGAGLGRSFHALRRPGSQLFRAGQPG